MTLKLVLDKRRRKHDGTYPLVFRIAIKSSSRDIPTGYSLQETHWNRRTCRIKDTHPAYRVMTDRITEQEVSLLTKLAQFEKEFPHETEVQNVKDYLLASPRKAIDVFSFWQDEITNLYRVGRSGGAQVYKEALIAINKVRPLNVPFEKIDYAFLCDVESDMRSRGVKLNTIGIHFRELRAIFNKAIKAKIVSRDFYPFYDYKIKREKTRPRTVSLEDMRRYFNLNLPSASHLYDSWLMGKLTFMLIGINFKDMILLNQQSIRGGRIFYSRAKTKTLYSIKILPAVEEILNHFHGRDEITLLGKITQQEIENSKRFTLHIRQKNKVFNKHLSKIGHMVGCQEKLTGYVFRYSWANIAKQLGYSKDLISEALGHQYGNRVTGIYLEGFDTKIIDTVNAAVANAVVKEAN